MDPFKQVNRRDALAGAGFIGLAALGAGTAFGQDSTGPPLRLGTSDVETFRNPSDAVVLGDPEQAQTTQVNEIVGLASATFTFKENANTPGQTHEQSKVVSVPSGAGFFCMIPYFTGAFTNSSFTHLTERPLGQFLVGVGLRGNNLVCQVRLSDKNSDDPIFIQVTAVVVFFK